MPGEPIKLGPFKGGMNLHSDPSTIGDDELVDCVNFEVDIDGTLISRPPLATVSNVGTWTQRILILGSVRFSNNNYLIGSNNDGTWYYHSGTWTLITSAVSASCVVQYNDAAYMIPYGTHPTISLFKWTPSGGYVNISPPNLNTMMGSGYGGSAMVVYKNRLFIVGGPFASTYKSRLFFSNAGAPEFWQTTSFIDINPGDGQDLMDLAVLDDNLILFKNHSTYVLTYTSAPSDAELLCVNKTIGTQWYTCSVNYENLIFVLHDNEVYQINNFNWQCITVKVPLYSNTTAPSPRVDNVFMSLVGDRLIVRLLNVVWVYQIRTGTWSRWVSQSDVLHNFGPLVELGNTNEYYAGSSIGADINVIRFIDSYSSTVIEDDNGTPYDIESTILTKNYDLTQSHKFKKLSWWGLDAITFNEVWGSVLPVVFGFLPTWGSINEEGKTWDDLEYWGSVLVQPRIGTNISSQNSGQLRRFFRFPHALRFRQVNFFIRLSGSGSTADGPAKLFSLTAVGSSKQTVPSDIN